MTVWLVCGGRDFDDSDWIDKELSARNVTAIVHGSYRGADDLAGQWARSKGIPEIPVPANWHHYKKKAGPIRNGWMIKFTRAEAVLAFPGGSGTENMIEQATEAGIPVHIVSKQ